MFNYKISQLMTLPSKLPYNCYGDNKGVVPTEKAGWFCKWTWDVINQFILMLCEEFEPRRLNSKVAMSMSVPGFSMTKTILLASFRTKYPARMVSMTYKPILNLRWYIEIPNKAAFSRFVQWIRNFILPVFYTSVS